MRLAVLRGIVGVVVSPAIACLGREVAVRALRVVDAVPLPESAVAIPVYAGGARKARELLGNVPETLERLVAPVAGLHAPAAGADAADLEGGREVQRDVGHDNDGLLRYHLAALARPDVAAAEGLERVRRRVPEPGADAGQLQHVALSRNHGTALASRRGAEHDRRPPRRLAVLDLEVRARHLPKVPGELVRQRTRRLAAGRHVDRRLDAVAEQLHARPALGRRGEHGLVLELGVDPEISGSAERNLAPPGLDRGLGGLDASLSA